MITCVLGYLDCYRAGLGYQVCLPHLPLLVLVPGPRLEQSPTSCDKHHRVRFRQLEKAAMQQQPLRRLDPYPLRRPYHLLDDVEAFDLVQRMLVLWW